VHSKLQIRASVESGGSGLAQFSQIGLSSSTASSSQRTRDGHLPGTAFDRARGARIYTLNLFDELASHASATSDLTRLCERRLVAHAPLNSNLSIGPRDRRAVTDCAPTAGSLSSLSERELAGSRRSL